MKKIVLLTLVLFATVIFTGCDGDDPMENIPTEINTANDLAGTWDFVSCGILPTDEYKTCNEWKAYMMLNNKTGYYMLSMTITPTNITVTDQCDGVIHNNQPYIFYNNGFNRNIQVNGYQYYIQSYSAPTLILRHNNLYITLRFRS
jgi:hypothetical protein